MARSPCPVEYRVGSGRMTVHCGLRLDVVKSSEYAGSSAADVGVVGVGTVPSFHRAVVTLSKLATLFWVKKPTSPEWVAKLAGTTTFRVATWSRSVLVSVT